MKRSLTLPLFNSPLNYGFWPKLIGSALVLRSLILSFYLANPEVIYLIVPLHVPELTIWLLTWPASILKRLTIRPLARLTLTTPPIVVLRVAIERIAT